MRKAILAAVTAALVLGGSLVVMAQADVAGTDDERGPIGSAIDEVLDDLVADDTLTRAQADAVIEALDARRAEFRAEREQMREQMEEFWADDQLTQEEIDQLPDWHHWSQMTDLLEDGVITRDELGGMRRGPFGGGGPRHGH